MNPNEKRIKKAIPIMIDSVNRKKMNATDELTRIAKSKSGFLEYVN
jgi:hypothetical protein